MRRPSGRRQHPSLQMHCCKKHRCASHGSVCCSLPTLRLSLWSTKPRDTVREASKSRSTAVICASAVLFDLSGPAVLLHQHHMCSSHAAAEPALFDYTKHLLLLQFVTAAALPAAAAPPIATRSCHHVLLYSPSCCATHPNSFMCQSRQLFFPSCSAWYSHK